VLPSVAGCNLTIILSKLALVHTEVTEAVTGAIASGIITWFDPARKNDKMVKGKPEGLGPELADVVIRCFQLAADVGIDLAAECETKMDYNDGRPHKHGKHA
jgi:NTP pyrophosphatase (non-canonical NTP hydrolase)